MISEPDVIPTNIHAIVYVYVDDILFAGEKRDEWQKFLDSFGVQVTEATDKGDRKIQFTGKVLRRRDSDGAFTISQKHYIDKVNTIDLEDIK